MNKLLGKPIEVSPKYNLGKLFAIESRVVAATPNILDTGSAEEFLRFLSEGGKPLTYIWHSESDEEVGLLALVNFQDTDDLEVRDIAIEQRHQRSGYGKAMMSFAEEIAKQLHKSRIILVTNPNNKPALKFYESLGYEIEREVSDYYGDGTPRYILSKVLKQ